MDALQFHEQILFVKPIVKENLAIVPMVLIPMTALTVALTSIAGIIASWFGIKLHTEGPKQLLEVLLKKRVLISMIIFNLIGLGLYQGYNYLKNMPRFIYTIARENKKIKKESTFFYKNSLFRNFSYELKVPKAEFKNLSLLKEIKLKKGAFRSGLIDGDSIFYGLNDGYIAEIDKYDLHTIRKFYVGTNVTTRPVIYENRIYTGEGSHDTHHARVYSFDLKTGDYLNAVSTKGHTEGQPVLAHYADKSLLFVAAGLDGLIVADPKTMQTIWHKKDGHLDASVSVENNRVYIGTGVEKGTDKNKSFAISYNFLDGKIIWKKQLPISNWMHPVITKTDLCFVLGEIYTSSDVGMVYCLNKFSGEPHFALPFDHPIASKPLYLFTNDSDYLFFSDFKGNICGVNLTNKTKLWCHKTGTDKTNYVLSSFEYDEKRNLLWYPSLDDGLFAIDPMSGKILKHWISDPKKSKWKSNYASVNIDGDNLYSLDLAGNLRKFIID